MKLRTIGAVSLILASAVTLGAPRKHVTRKASSHNAVYVLGQAGISKLDAAGTNLYKNWSPSYRLAGGYMLTKTLGVEAGYSRLAKYTYKNKTFTEKWSGNVIDVLGVLDYKLDRKTSLLAKAGVARVSQDLGKSLSDTEYRPEVQLGVGYKLSRNLTASVAYDGIYGKRDQNDASKLKTLPTHSLLAGLQYNL